VIDKSIGVRHEAWCCLV